MHCSYQGCICVKFMISENSRRIASVTKPTNSLAQILYVAASAIAQLKIKIKSEPFVNPSLNDRGF